MDVVSSSPDAYPVRAVRLLVPFPPGGSTEFTARSLAEPLREILGQPFFVEARVGDFGLAALRELLHADPYTLMVGSVNTNSIAPVVFRRSMNFDYVDPLQSHPIGAALAEVAPGFTLRPPLARSASAALDYFRAPLFDWPTGVAVPSTGPGADDDLQDVLTTYLRLLRDQNGELFAFGAKFPEPGQSPNPRPIDHEFHTVQGIHDIHMNQGNPNPGALRERQRGVFRTAASS